MKKKNQRKVLPEVCRELSVDEEFVIHCLEEHWVLPEDPDQNSLDEEDTARLRLILDLKEMGINEEAVPVILHLLDQIIAIQGKIREARDRAA